MFLSLSFSLPSHLSKNKIKKSKKKENNFTTLLWKYEERGKFLEIQAPILNYIFSFKQSICSMIFYLTQQPCVISDLCNAINIAKMRKKQMDSVLLYQQALPLVVCRPNYKSLVLRSCEKSVCGKKEALSLQQIQHCTPLLSLLDTFCLFLQKCCNVQSKD